jgi:2-keto-4-pentenoate hydratase/2-oxohepta-3-ene-1,7-dioic acid hydratase in catechol pathway
MSVIRWVRFRASDGGIGFGQWEDDGIVEFAGDLFDSPEPTGRIVAMTSVKLLAPCVPSKVIALWNNFRALASKLGKAEPAHPLFFFKPTSSIIGPDEPIRRPRGYLGKIVFEGELGIVIGRCCKDVPAEDALDYVFGYTCINDVTAADILNESPDFAQWSRSKSFDTFGCMGPCIATDIDLGGARIITRVGDSERQNYLVADMIIPPAELVSRLSRDMTLLAGDVIACGTSLGVGSIRDGVTVDVSISGIGSLANTLVAPA